ncbi:MAG: type II toxin-antitoxin system Phd/YefM family antitoxin [Burkholderiales bacterium]|nr:type II toxin-antitoxin system Phd/YefM family antitoxin [Burkholderiales bacterium]
MHTVTATDLKNRLGQILDAAAWAPVAVERHGKVVAYLVPAAAGEPRRRALTPPRRMRGKWGRSQEDRVVRLCASRDFRPSRWARAGNRDFLGGVAAMLASLPDFDRARMLALAEALSPGMSRTDTFAGWLEASPLDPARFLPMLRERMSNEAARP